MGSGLILLVIVGAWLAVLVPMALRSHDSATSLKSTDRFSDAMRVLSRRGDRAVVVPRRGPSLVVSETKSARPDPADLGGYVSTEIIPREPLTPAERRRRLLLGLLGTSVVTLGLALTAVPALLWVNLLADLLLVAFVVHLRRQAVLRAERRARARRARPVAAAAPLRARPLRVAGIPDRMPARPAPLTTPLPAPAARYEDKPLAATGTGGQAWSPVPVPVPTYVGKAAAPQRTPRVLDLTHPGEWSTGLEADTGLEILDDGPELDDILTRRRASGGW